MKPVCDSQRSGGLRCAPAEPHRWATTVPVTAASMGSLSLSLDDLIKSEKKKKAGGPKNLKGGSERGIKKQQRKPEPVLDNSIEIDIGASVVTSRS